MRNQAANTIHVLFMYYTNIVFELYISCKRISYPLADQAQFNYFGI